MERLVVDSDSVVVIERVVVEGSARSTAVATPWDPLNVDVIDGVTGSKEKAGLDALADDDDAGMTDAGMSELLADEDASRL